ncbi:hypothetical protein BLJ79_09240 [Arthrobacter sp. UCD-GKA]|uniref:multicopper oxidase domain-containing protein n=1 Tax=Arthrobacter sp. UCD-GKA TaxID=1913576 RepID=UPI0008DD383D|nr:multicopper oxidase domain-containing protein [Arthrobacter sp. UCD-GKA]OIH85343.1 hypothetical protein BLJ79_09240 [Arthrobacter sp. UCD-GKA]
MTQQLKRRSFLGLSIATTAVAALAACTPTLPTKAGAARILPTHPIIATYEARRVSTGKTVSQTLTAGPLSTTRAGRAITTWGYNDSLVAPTLRGTVGDQLNVTVTNKLTESTSIHWHGLAMRNDADGVPGLTQKEIGAGTNFPYDFKLPHPGTYWYHSHVEMQRERALYGALIIDDPQEPGSW